MSNVLVRVSYLAYLVLLAPLLAFGGVSEKWVAETTEISPHEITAYHGETVNMTVTFTENGRIIRPSSASASFLWQTNGMGKSWWSTNATYKCGVVTGSFGPTMDTGATDVTFFFWVTDGKGGNYRANGKINLLDSPFFDIHILGTPTKILDFGLVSVTNADLAPWAMKGSGGGGGADTNTVRVLIDASFVGGTQNVNRVVCSFDSVSNKVDTIQGELHTNVTLLVENKTLSIREGDSNIWSSTEAAVQVQSDWNVTDTSSKAYIQNKPTIIMENESKSQKQVPFEEKILNSDVGEIVIGGEIYSDESKCGSIINGFSLESKLNGISCGSPSKAQIVTNDGCLVNYARNIIGKQTDMIYVPNEGDINIYIESSCSNDNIISVFDLNGRSVYYSFSGNLVFDGLYDYHIISRYNKIFIERINHPSPVKEARQYKRKLVSAVLNFNFPYYEYVDGFGDGTSTSRGGITPNTPGAVITSVTIPLREYWIGDFYNLNTGFSNLVMEVIYENGCTNMYCDSVKFNKNGRYYVTLYTTSTNSMRNSYHGFPNMPVFTINQEKGYVYTAHQSIDYVESIKFYSEIDTLIGPSYYDYSLLIPVGTEMLSDTLIYNDSRIKLDDLCLETYNLYGVKDIDLSNIKVLKYNCFSGSNVTNLDVSTITNYVVADYMHSPVSDMKYLKSVTLPTDFFDLLPSETHFLFVNDESLEEINGVSNIFDNIKICGYGNFRNCKSFKFGNLKVSNATKIGQVCFSECDNLYGIRGDKVKSIDPFAFYKCVNLTNITVNAIEEFCQYSLYEINNYIDIYVLNSDKIQVTNNWGHAASYPFGLSNGCFHCKDGDLYVINGTNDIAFTSDSMADKNILKVTSGVAEHCVRIHKTLNECKELKDGEFIFQKSNNKKIQSYESHL